MEYDKLDLKTYAKYANYCTLNLLCMKEDVLHKDKNETAMCRQARVQKLLNECFKIL